MMSATIGPAHVQTLAYSHTRTHMHHLNFRSHLHMSLEHCMLGPDSDASAVLDYLLFEMGVKNAQRPTRTLSASSAADCF